MTALNRQNCPLGEEAFPEADKRAFVPQAFYAADLSIFPVDFSSFNLISLPYWISPRISPNGVSTTPRTHAQHLSELPKAGAVDGGAGSRTTCWQLRGGANDGRYPA